MSYRTENRKLRLFWEAGLSLLLLTGALLALSAPWGMRTPAQLWALGAGGLVWALSCAAAHTGRRVAAWALRLVPWCLVAVLAGPAAVWDGFRLWVNCVFSNWNDLHQGALPLFSTGAGGEASVRAVSIAAATGLGQLAEYLVNRRRLLLCGVLGMLLLVLQLVGGAFSAWGSGLMFAGLLGLWMSGAEELPTRQTLRAWGLCALALCLCARFAPAGEMSSVTRLRQQLQQEVHTLRYGVDLLPQGRIDRARILHQGDQELLRVKTQQEKSLYLKGFVGSVYENGVWTPLPDAAYGGEYAGMLDWLAQEGFDPLSQSAAYYALCDPDSAPEGNRVEVEVTGASRYYVYAPASVQDAALNQRMEKKDHRLRSTGLWGARNYTMEEYSSQKPAELTIREDWVTSPETEEQLRYTQAEAVYREFVYQNYTAVDAKLAPVVKKLFWEDYTGSGIYSALEQIRDVLKRTVHYTQDVPQTEEDPLYAFLTDSREGNAVLYASAAVEALRMQGYPARYVEGYYLPLSDVSAGDGDVTLTTQDAHAWAEVYFDGIGWLPVDVTPGYYLDTVLLQQMVSLPDTAGKTAALDKGDEGVDEIAKNLNGGGEVPTVPEIIARDIAALLLGLAAVCIVAATLALLVLEGTRLLLERRAGRKYALAGEREKSLMLTERILFLLSLWGIDACLGWKTETADREAAQRIPGIESGEYRRAAELLEKAVYGGVTLEPFEQRTVMTLLDKLLTGEKKKTVLLYWKLRYSRALALFAAVSERSAGAAGAQA